MHASQWDKKHSVYLANLCKHTLVCIKLGQHPIGACHKGAIVLPLVHHNTNKKYSVCQLGPPSRV